uniref:AlNc14C351G10902 protein n=1 Tax=Albugo laibachii Nc14 TaxID=890382 RepID=F0WXF1_9STRA|nr:AlNc14C351G10902 [Albugo laibachii Nc14]|eukprot:CCA26143.1 AlNc14C351G10902 [Albugo laibachii Nc14]
MSPHCSLRRFSTNSFEVSNFPAVVALCCPLRIWMVQSSHSTDSITSLTLQFFRSLYCGIGVHKASNLFSEQRRLNESCCKMIKNHVSLAPKTQESGTFDCPFSQMR